jgi:hypothetical protein
MYIYLLTKKVTLKKNYFPNNSICVVNFNKFTNSYEKIKKIKKIKHHFSYNFASLKKKENISIKFSQRNL